VLREFIEGASTFADALTPATNLNSPSGRSITGDSAIRPPPPPPLPLVIRALNYFTDAELISRRSSSPLPLHPFSYFPDYSPTRVPGLMTRLRGGVVVALTSEF